MSRIVVICACGKKFAANPQRAGQQLPCPNCGESILVPNAAAPPPQSDPFADAVMNDPFQSAAARPASEPLASPAARSATTSTPPSAPSPAAGTSAQQLIGGLLLAVVALCASVQLLN